MSKSTVGKWLEAKWMEWERETGARKSQVELAEHLGITKFALNQYLNGKRLPTGEGLVRIADKFGPEIYDLLGLVRPEKYQVRDALVELVGQVPEDRREELRRLIEDYLIDHGFRRES